MHTYPKPSEICTVHRTFFNVRNTDVDEESRVAIARKDNTSSVDDELIFVYGIQLNQIKSNQISRMGDGKRRRWVS